MKKNLFMFALAFCLSQISIAQILPTLPSLQSNTVTDVKKNEIKKGHIISIEPFAPFLRHFTLGHEVGLGHDYSLETKFSFIRSTPEKTEFGYDDPFLEEGFFVRSGLKFYFQKDYVNNGLERYHRFQGWYLKPEAVFGYLKSTHVTNSAANQNILISALLLNIGKQWIFADRFAFGCEVGVGYSFSRENSSYRSGYSNASARYNEGYYYAYAANTGRNVGLAFSAGLNLGIILDRGKTTHLPLR